MSARSRQRSRQGTCSVLNESALEEMKVDTEDYRSQYDPTACSARKYSSQRSNTAQTRHSLVEQLVKQTMEQTKWIDEKRITDIQAKADSDAQGTRNMYQQVLHTENTLVKEMQDYVAKKEMLNQRKRELLHKRWTENVNEPIRREIVNELNSPNYEEFTRRKKELYKEYLEHCNRKGHVFLDVISPDEYYPLALHPARPSLLKAKGRPPSPKAQTPKLKDPLLQAERDRCAEERVVIRCMTGYDVTDRDVAAISLPPLPLRPLGRHGTQCSTWINMNLGDIESPARMASRRRMFGNANHSDLGISNWGQPPPPPPPKPSIKSDTEKCGTPPSWSMTSIVPEDTVPKPPVAPENSGTEIRLQADEYKKTLHGHPVVAI